MVLFAGAHLCAPLHLPLPCSGRTGEHFMKIAKAGNIHNFW